MCCVHVSHVWCKGWQQAGGGREETGRLTSGETEEHRGGNLPGALDLGGSLQDTRRAKGFLRITHEPRQGNAKEKKISQLRNKINQLLLGHRMGVRES